MPPVTLSTMLSSQMIDLIHDTITTNFIYAYNYALNTPGKKQTR